MLNYHSNNVKLLKIFIYFPFKCFNTDLVSFGSGLIEKYPNFESIKSTMESIGGKRRFYNDVFVKKAIKRC